MKPKLLFFLICNLQFVICNSSFSQPVSQEWVATYHNPSNLSAVSDYIITDHLGNIYVSGEQNTLSQGIDMVTIKYNTSGVQQWAIVYNGPGNGDDVPQGIAVDDSSNIYVTGYSAGAGTGIDWVIIKYNNTGNQLWLKRFNGTNNLDDYPAGPVLDNLGYLYVTGNTYLPGTNGADVMTIKYNAYTGDSIWARRFHEQPDPYGHYNDGSVSLAIDKLENVIVIADSYYTFGPPGNDWLTLKYDQNGNFQWSRKYDGPAHGNDYPVSVVLDSLNNIYVCGSSFNLSYNSDCLLIKYNTNGVQQWSALFNSTTNGGSAPYGMLMDKLENIFITGSLYTNSTYFDYFTIKYNLNGDSLWVRLYNGPGNGDDEAYGIVLDDSSNVYVTGRSINANNHYVLTTIKYNSSGIQQWLISHAGYVGNPHGNPISIDNSRNIFVTMEDTNFNMETIKYSQLTNISPIIKIIPKSFELYQNYPNPFNPSTIIRFDLPRNSSVKLEVYDILGRVVETLVNEELKNGKYEYVYNGENLSSGIYFYRLYYENEVLTKKMLMIK